MSLDEDFLAPRGLLAEDKYPHDNSSFTFYRSIVGAIFLYPTTRELFGQFFKFTDAGLEVLGDTVVEAVRGLAEINDQYSALNGAFVNIGTISSDILALAETAEEDYDIIFDGLRRLYEDESDNDDLRAFVKAKVDGRLAIVRNSSSLATKVRSIMHNATDTLRPAQNHIIETGRLLFLSGMRSRLRERIQDDNEFWRNAIALFGVKMWMVGLFLLGPTVNTVQNVEKIAGAAAAMDLDLIHLIELVDKSTKPGPNPLLNVNKANILKRWSNVEAAVKKFKREYYDWPGAVEDLDFGLNMANCWNE